METDTFQALAKIHPLQLPRLIVQTVLALAQATGVPGVDTDAYAPLLIVKERKALETLDWGSVTQLLREKATCDEGVLGASIDAARLLLNRAELHAWLYLDAKHSSTLKLQGKYNMPTVSLPAEHLDEYAYFQQLLDKSDTALDAGQAGLNQFQQLAIHQTVYQQLRGVLDQSYTFYIQYDSARTQADRIFETLCQA